MRNIILLGVFFLGLTVAHAESQPKEPSLQCKKVHELVHENLRYGPFMLKNKRMLKEMGEEQFGAYFRQHIVEELELFHFLGGYPETVDLPDGKADRIRYIKACEPDFANRMILFKPFMSRGGPKRVLGIVASGCGRAWMGKDFFETEERVRALLENIPADRVDRSEALVAADEAGRVRREWLASTNSKFCGSRSGGLACYIGFNGRGSCSGGPTPLESCEKDLKEERERAAVGVSTCERVVGLLK